MSRAGGIAYLLKHGRAPLPTVTRTEMPRGMKRMAGGGTTAPANQPLNYGNVPNYEYNPSSQNVAPHYELGPDGKLRFVPGRYYSGVYGSPTSTPSTAAPASAGTAQQQQYANDGRDRSDAGGGFRSESPLAGLSKTGTVMGDLTLALDAYGNALGGWLPGGFLARAVSQAMMPSATIATAKAARDALAAEIAKDPFFGGGGYEGPGGKTSATGAGIASNPMGRDPAQAQGQGTGGTSDTTGAGNPMGLDPAQRGEAASREAAEAAVGKEAADRGVAEGGNDASPGAGEARGGLNLGGKYYPHMATGGITALAGGGHTQGPRLLSGGGDGLSDGIPAVIGRNQPARLADGEFVVSADVVSALGGGSTKAGAKKLYDMMDRIRKQAHGTKKQVKKVSERKVLPA